MVREVKKTKRAQYHERQPKNIFQEFGQNAAETPSKMKMKKYPLVTLSKRCFREIMRAETKSAWRDEEMETACVDNSFKKFGWKERMVVVRRGNRIKGEFFTQKD